MTAVACLPRPVLFINQEHWSSTRAHSVSSGATVSRSAGLVRLRSKPPCLITFKPCAAASSSRLSAGLKSGPPPPSGTTKPRKVALHAPRTNLGELLRTSGYSGRAPHSSPRSTGGRFSSCPLFPIPLLRRRVRSSHTTRWAALATRSCEHPSTKSSSAYNLGKSLSCSTETGSNSCLSFPVRSTRTWVSSWIAYPMCFGSRERTARSAMSRMAIRHFCANSKFARGEAEFSRVIESSSLSSGDFRSFHSCGLLVAFLGDLSERAAIAVEGRRLSRILLPANDYDLGILWIDFYQARFSSAALARDQGRTRASAEIRADIAGLAAVDQRALDQRDGFHRRMQTIRRRLVFFPERGLRFVAIPGVRFARNVAVKQGFVLEFVPSKSPRKRILCPYDL